jgi:threonine dehydrogenase-like Zn-dependent dehydrogenase
MFQANPRPLQKALNLMASGTVEVKPLITRHMELDEMMDAFGI